MYLRVASTAGARRLIRYRRFPAQGALILVLLTGWLALGACARQAAVGNEVRIEWSLRPNPPVVGVPTVGEMALHDGERRFVRGATVHVVAHMSHPGMAPVAARVEERHDGVHDVHLQFTMAGDWVVHVTGALPDGRPLDEWLAVPGVRTGN